MAELSRLPIPIADTYAWQQEGACREADPRLFFHPDGERGPARANRDAAAVQVCAGCPVIQACRSHALSVREPYGVWGGLTQDDRDAIYSGAQPSRQAAAWPTIAANSSDTGMPATSAIIVMTLVRAKEQ